MTKVICPHCEEPLGFEDICWSPIGTEKNEKKPLVYYCPKCQKILGFTND
ncbi:MAG: hypothetical protein ACTSQK_10890 [Candidatus Heimdallarchaeota archaeon]